MCPRHLSSGFVTRSRLGERFENPREPPRARLGFFRGLDRFSVFALMGVAQREPTLPRARLRLERTHQILRRLDFALFAVELDAIVLR